MFSLIVSIIAIALVSILAIATIYYGGDAFQEGTSDAAASTIVNQAQQIEGAYVISESEGVLLTELDDLVPDYLDDIPSYEKFDWGHNGATDLSDATHFIMEIDDNVEICEAIQEMYLNDSTVETASDISNLIQSSSIMGCYLNSGTNKHTAYYVVR